MACNRSPIALVLLALLAAACGGSSKPPTAPGDLPGGADIPTTPTVSPLAGSWLAVGQVLTCTGPACSEWVTQPERPGEFHLNVIEQGGSLTALLDMDLRVHITVELSGVPQPDGSVRFNGSSRPPSSLSAGTAEVNALEIRADQESRLSGSFHYTLFWKTGVSTITGRIISARSRPSLPIETCAGGGSGGCFNGTWEGSFVIRTLDRCTDGCVRATPGRDMRLNLRLVEEHGVLSGSALISDWLTVTGNVTGTRALLTGRGQTDPCGNPGPDGSVICSDVIEDLSVSLDQFGRMSGTLRYAREGWDGYTSGSEHYNFAVTGDLWNLVRVK